MKTMLEILMTAPPEQVTRCKIALVEIAHGHWDAAASTMEDAIDESEVGEWAFDCMEMRMCRSRRRKINPRKQAASIVEIADH